MFDHSFFSSKLGHAALVSVVAMVAFTVFAQMQTGIGSPDVMLTATPLVELA